MKNVTIYGTIFGPSGFASHIRQLANALHEQGCAVKIEGQLIPGWEQQVNDAELLMITREISQQSVGVMVGQPQFLPHMFSNRHKYNVMFVIWEGDRVPKYWEKYLNHEKTDQVWVPSTHVKRAIENTFTCNKPIYIVPHGVNPSLFKPKTEKSHPDYFSFVANKGWAQGINDRGGLQYLFKAFSEEFRADEKVLLKAKINPAYCLPGWDINQELAKLNLPKDRAQILISIDNLPFNKLNDCYEGDVFVSPTRCEAFNMPVIEAMACGLPVITTNFGGQTDFVNDRNGWLIDYDLEEIKWDHNYEGVKWAIPHITHLRMLMRYCFKHPEECKKKGEKALHDAAAFTWKLTAKAANNALERL